MRASSIMSKLRCAHRRGGSSIRVADWSHAPAMMRIGAINPSSLPSSEIPSKARHAALQSATAACRTQFRA